MLLKLDFGSDVPIYTQLKEQIIEGIAIGLLEPGEPLPSVRQMASDLGINLHTVNKAYNYLRQDGFIIIHRQKGVVVNNERGVTVTSVYRDNLKNSLYPMIAEAYCRGMNQNEFSELCQGIFGELKRKGGK